MRAFAGWVRWCADALKPQHLRASHKSNRPNDAALLLKRMLMGMCNDRGSRRLAAAEALFCVEIECPRAHWRGRNRGSVSSGQRGPSV